VTIADRIHIRGLEAFAFHGVYPEEAAHGQRFVVDLTLHVDLRAAGETDDLAHTIHYGELAKAVKAVLTGERHDLIERVAQRVADVALADPRVGAVDVAVHKPDAPVDVPVADIVVEVHRTR
jgi:dihydroneopterin aldolase